MVVARVYAVAFSPDGRTFALGTSDGLIALWDTASRAKLCQWQLPGPVHDLTFAHDGRHLATANGNGTIYILRIADGPPRALSAEKAKQQQADEAKHLGVPVHITNSIGMKLNLIPSGRFLMGSPENEAGRRADEGPQHEVEIAKPFYFGVHEQEVRAIIEHYDQLSEDEFARGIETAPGVTDETLISVPTELLPVVRKLIRRN